MYRDILGPYLSETRGKRFRLLEAHLMDSSPSALSKSSVPSFFALAFCFFRAFHSFFEALSGGGDVDCITSLDLASAIVMRDSISSFPS